MILATGPLTSAALSADIARLVGQEHLYFYDAISPIVLAESIDHEKVFRQSRWDRNVRLSHSPGYGGRAAGRYDWTHRQPIGLRSGRRGGRLSELSDDARGVRAFHDAVVHAESATVHDFDKAKFFEGCLPIEVMAHRGQDTLRFGPMKPVGLVDPRTGRAPYAAVQLRQDNLAGDHYSLVGFQTQLKWGEQERVLRLIPGLEHAEFVRFGMVHRNTYINGPTVLDETWQVRRRPSLFCAGQMSGVEGYVESAASGLLAGLNAAALASGRPTAAPPRTTAIGALSYYVSHANPRALPAVEHHVRHHAAARAGAEAQARTQGGDCRARAGRSRNLDAWTHISKPSCSFSGLIAARRRTRCAPTRAT